MKKLKNTIINPKNNKYNKIINEQSNNNISKRGNKFFEKSNYKRLKNKKGKEKSNIKYFLIIGVFLIIIILSFIIIKLTYLRYNDYYEDDNDNYIPDNATIYFEEKFDSFKDAYDKSKDFLKQNLNGILINTEKVQLSKKPKISVVIPCYNCRRKILRAIRSVQNQDFQNFEIIIVNDASNDNSSLYLDELKKEESRLRIINNEKNMGTLYTRSIGSLSAKGKYIFPMDGDDMFLDRDVFTTIIKIAEKGNFDITIFNSVYTTLKPNVDTTKIHHTFYEACHKPNLVLFQPDLAFYQISAKDNLEKIYINEVLLHAKCIKTKIYKKALNKLGKERYSRHMLHGEDDLANTIIFHTAKSAKYVPKYGYLYINNNSNSFKNRNDYFKYTEQLLYIFDAFIDFSLDFPRNKKVLVNFMIYLFNNEFLQETLNSTEYNNKLFNSCLDRIFKCKYISDEHKNEIRKRGKNLGFIKYKF